MKIGENIYICDWCGNKIMARGTKFKSAKNTTFPGSVRGKQNVSSQLICNKCGRFVKQK